MLWAATLTEVTDCTGGRSLDYAAKLSGSPSLSALVACCSSS